MIFYVGTSTKHISLQKLFWQSFNLLQRPLNSPGWRWNEEQTKVKVSCQEAESEEPGWHTDTFIRRNNRLRDICTYLVKNSDQLASLHRQVILVLAMVAVQNYELPVRVFEEWMDLRLRLGLREEGAAARLTTPNIELQTGVLEAVTVTLLQALVHWKQAH